MCGVIILEKIKILYVITALNIGGAEMMLYRMLRQVNQERFDVSVAALINKGPVGEMIEKDLKVSVISLGVSNFFNFFVGLFRLVRFIKANSVMIVHSHMVHANIMSRIARLFYYFPALISTIHNYEEKGRKKTARWRELAYRVTDPLCDLTTQVSQSGLTKYVALKAVPESKIAYMPNGIDISYYDVDRDRSNEVKKKLGLLDHHVFLAVGSLTLQKDYTNMLKAFSMVRAKVPNVALVIAGIGPLENELKELSRKLDLSGAIHFLGLRNDINILMNMADVFVMSSAWEGMPIVLLEAAASKLPIIATDVGGNRDLVLDGESGFIVPPGNPEALAKAMGAMHEMQREKRELMGSKGYDYVKVHYDLEMITKEWEEIYHNLLVRKGYDVQ